MMQVTPVEVDILDREAMMKRFTKEEILNNLILSEGLRDSMQKRVTRLESELRDAQRNRINVDDVLQAKVEEIALLRRMCRALLDATSPDYSAPDVDG